MRLRHLWFTLLCSSLALFGYAQLPQRLLKPLTRRPDVSFRASSTTLRAGTPVTLTWRVMGGAGWDTFLLPEVGRTTDTSATFTPQYSSTYTLLVQNPLGSVQRDLRVAVQAAAPGSPAAPTQTATGGAATDDNNTGDSAPSGTFGVSATEDGPFLSDRVGGISDPDDERIVRVAPGGVFFAQASFRDPDGIAGITLNLVNSDPEGLAGSLSPTRLPFTVEGEPGGCNLSALPTEVRCVFRVRVEEDARNISALPGAGDEFAYVFRVRVADGLGNSASRPIRGYVIVE